MLLKMLPEAISAIWPEVKHQIAEALPEKERSDKVLNGILEAILLDRISCWISYDQRNNNQANFVLLLVPFANGFTGEKILNIYSITRIAKMDLKTSNRMWLEGFAALKIYMKSCGYSKLIGYFDEENVRSLRMAKRFGAVVKHCIEIDVEV